MKLPLFNRYQYLKMSNHYQQGFYRPRNPQKYRGDPTQIFMRSSWERRFSTWADMNPSVVEWGSETVIIPYISPVDGRPHRYFVRVNLTLKRDRPCIPNEVGSQNLNESSKKTEPMPSIRQNGNMPRTTQRRGVGSLSF